MCVHFFGLNLKTPFMQDLQCPCSPVWSPSEVEPGKAGCRVATVNRIGPTWVDILRTWSNQCTFGGLLGFQLCKVDTQSWKCIALKIKCIFDIFFWKLMCLKPWVPESLRNLCDWWGINASSVYRINIVTMTQCCFCYSSFYHLCLKSG